MSKRKSITGDMSLEDVILEMCEGNPGGLNVMMSMMHQLGTMDAVRNILLLDDMDIRGSQIWVAYKDHCGGDMDKFTKLIMSRDLEMIATVNRECPDRVAVRNGGSWRK